MKKKLLSLVLAGAMVASTSVSAFAADTVINTNEGTANVTISGAVEGNNGEAPSGTISVSIPTALSFSVNKDGEVSGGNIIINNEIPKTIPVADYAGYIMKNFKPNVIKFKKPESEWTEEEHTEYTKWSLKLSMAHRFKQQIQENKPLTNRDKRIIERFRSGTDFFGEKICGKETSRLFEQPYTFDLFDEWQEKHFKEHPEDKDKTIEELFDIRLSEQKLYHYKEVNGKYYGAEIPKEIHYTEYFRYLYFNVKYEFSEKTYYRSIP